MPMRGARALLAALLTMGVSAVVAAQVPPHSANSTRAEAPGTSGAFAPHGTSTDPSRLAARRADTVLMATDPDFRAVQDALGFADAVIDGDRVYLSGVVAILGPNDTDMEAALDTAYRTIGATLARAGSSWDDVLDITSFHTDIAGQLPIVSRVQKRYLGNPPPAWTAIGVAQLATPRAFTEIKVVARRTPASAP